MSTPSKTTTPPERRLYGNWVASASSGIAGTGTIGTIVLLGGAGLFMVVLLTAGWWPAVFVGLLGVAVFVATTSTARHVARFVGFHAARASGETQWRSGVFSRQSAGTRLPGMLGRLELLEHADPFGTPFAVIRNPHGEAGVWTLVVRCVADGPWMQDQPQVDSWVASYAGFLAGLGQDNAVICAKAITDTAPDPGGKLAMTVEAGRAAQAPSVARQVIDQVVATYPAASSENVTYVEVTYDGRSLSRKGNEAAIMVELSRRVPGLRGRLEAAGGGAVSMVTKPELPALVRAAYDPASQRFIEQAALSGHRHVVEWAEAGPVASQEAWDHLLHDSGKSITWEMIEAPRSSVSERSLTGLLAPSPEFARKRVALIYRPHSPATAASVSESDVDTAVFNADQGRKRVTARARLRVAATERSRDEVASGAGMVRFSVLVTATVPSGPTGDIDQAAASIEGNASAVLMRLRRCYGSQAAGFAATLPVGFVPWLHTVVPDQIRELL